MARYRMRLCECEAQKIDRQWYNFLVHEQKRTGIDMGDYLVKCADGREEIWAPDKFENLFYELPNE